MKRTLMSMLCGMTMVLAALLAPHSEGQEKPPDKPKPAKGKGYKPLSPAKKAAFQAQSRAQHGQRIAMLQKFQVLPAAFNCKDKGWCMPVGDQGQCGSCYLYSTTQNITNAFIKAGYGKPDGSFFLSVQFGMDCNSFGGCDGGNGNEVVDYYCKHGGLPAEKYVDLSGKTINDYPAYTASSGNCRKPANAKMWLPASWGYVNANGNPTTDEIKTALFNYGSLNVALDAGGQFGTGTGTITSLGSSIDHEIQLIAWDDNKDGGAFLLQNQWNTDWGVDGYRWCTYKAAQNLVDIFWVTATPLPPPPVPVCPPGQHWDDAQQKCIPDAPVPPIPPNPNGVPVITSPLTSFALIGTPYTYQITATNAPVVYTAVGLPAGFFCSITGAITGTANMPGTYSAKIYAINDNGAGSATLTLACGLTPPPIGKVSIDLTPDQIQSVLAQVVRPETTVRELLEMLNKGPIREGPPMLKAAPCDRLNSLLEDTERLRKRQAELEALLNKLEAKPVKP